ncbi:MAG: superoxide dismutase [Friedmanniella sp.]
MTMRSGLKLMAVALTSAALTVTLAGPVVAQPRAALPSRIALPDGFQPEGIAARGPIAYLGSRTDGDIFAVDLRSGKGGVISQGPGAGFPSVGVKVGTTRLYVSGGNAGTGRVVDIRTGAILASHTFTKNPSFVNDVVLTKGRAWFTDSLQPQLYGLTRTGNAGAATVRTLKLRGDWVQAPAVNNANGIAQSPDKRSLLVVQSNTGFLFKVNPRTGVARRVNLGGTLLTNGDGLLVRGRTLYAVQNRLNQVVVIRLNASGSRGRKTDTLTKADLPGGTSFDVPTTAAFYRGNLYLPNARFGTAEPETADYWVTRLPLSR